MNKINSCKLSFTRIFIHNFFQMYWTDAIYCSGDDDDHDKNLTFQKNNNNDKHGWCHVVFFFFFRV